MSIGYACVNPVLPNTGFRKCRKSQVTDVILSELISRNLDALERLIEYNISKNIKLFRIGSDLIPFASDPINTLDWKSEYRERFRAIGNKIVSSGMRVSMHPGQYTVLNSPDEKVYTNSVLDLEYHCSVLDLLETGPENKIVLHIGGAYGDKKSAIQTFGKAFKTLDRSIRNRLVIENDDRIFNIEEVLEIGNELSIPVVFDNLHNSINPSQTHMSEHEWMIRCSHTWLGNDGVQKIHYSQQDKNKRPGAHSDRIDIKEFMGFISSFKDNVPDIMLEVKDKNLSTVKCILSTAEGRNRQIRKLEEEWSLYKYKILELSAQSYKSIRELLKLKREYPVTEFYDLIDKSLELPLDPMNARNAALHVWGYFKDKAQDKEKIKFFRSLNDYCDGKIKTPTYKTLLYDLAVKYQQEYLVKSYYFFI